MGSVNNAPRVTQNVVCPLLLLRRAGEAAGVGAGKGDDEFGSVFEGGGLEAARESPSIFGIFYPAFRCGKFVDIKRTCGNIGSGRHQGVLNLSRHYFFPLNSFSHGQNCGLILSRAQICRQDS